MSILAVLFGDSISAGWGVSPADALEAGLLARSQSAGLDVTWVNAGVPGGTSGQGLARLSSCLKREPALAVVQFGGNDIFCGVGLPELEDNLVAIAESFRDVGAVPVIAGTGFQVFGDAAAQSMAAVWRSAAERSSSILIPDLLTGVAGVPALEQGDGVHPNADGYRLICDTAWEVLRPAIEGLGPVARS
jgi:acyl-CoA thioesterase-1